MDSSRQFPGKHLPEKSGEPVWSPEEAQRLQTREFVAFRIKITKKQALLASGGKQGASKTVGDDGFTVREQYLALEVVATVGPIGRVNNENRRRPKSGLPRFEFPR